MTATDQDITENNKQDAQEFEGLQTPLSVSVGFLRVEASGAWIFSNRGYCFVGNLCTAFNTNRPYDLTSVTILDSRLAPGEKMMSGTVAYLGTDGAGQRYGERHDLWSGISLGVGIGSGIIAMLIGISFGLLSAYAGGRIDALFMRIVDIQQFSRHFGCACFIGYAWKRCR